jgi:hypothetical protein
MKRVLTLILLLTQFGANTATVESYKHNIRYRNALQKCDHMLCEIEHELQQMDESLRKSNCPEHEQKILLIQEGILKIREPIQELQKKLQELQMQAYREMQAYRIFR